MTTQKSVHLDNARTIQLDIIQLLDGMGYCLDWRPEASSWSARQVVYHLLDTPPSGLPRVIRGVFSGELEEFELWADLDNINPDRTSYDLEQVQKDISGFFDSMMEVLEAAAEEEFEQKSVLLHQRNRGWDEPRTVQNLLEGLFARHWRDHLGQIRELRESLGM